MVRLKSSFAWFALVLVLGAGAGLYLTGRLEVRWSGISDREDHRKEGAQPHVEEDGEHHEEQSHVVDGKVVLDAETLRASGIRTAPVMKGSVALSLRATGEVQLAEGRFAHVTPRIPGVIREIHRTIGDPVAVGTPLCTIESVELGEARAGFVSARSERTLAERNYHRWKQLYEEGLKTQNEFWVAENKFTRVKLREDAVRNKLKALGIGTEEIAALEQAGSRAVGNRYEISSPIAGSVLERQLTLGEYVEAKDQLFLVADLSEVWVQTAVYERDLTAVQRGMLGRVYVLGFPGVSFEGRVTYVGQKVDEKTRAVPLRVAVKNRPLPDSEEPFALRPGMFATVDLETSRKTDVRVVPLAAVQTVNSETVVFMQSTRPEHAKHRGSTTGRDTHEAEVGKFGSATFERRPVTLGARDAEVAEVIHGIEPGEAVVVENAYLLKSEFEKSQIGEGDAD